MSESSDSGEPITPGGEPANGPTQPTSSANGSRRNPRWWPFDKGGSSYLWYFAVVTGVAIFFAGLYGNTAKSWGTATVVGLASFFAVGLVGFLFGVPPDRGEAVSNQSIPQIADWLTKIVIGAGLVEIRNVSSFVARAGRGAACAAGLSRASGPVFAALIVAAGACGFGFYYYWSAMYWEDLRGATPNMRLLRQLNQLNRDKLLPDEDYGRLRGQVVDAMSLDLSVREAGDEEAPGSTG